MINEGKQEGWLKLPAEALQPWAALNNVKLHDVRVGVDPEHPERGAGVFAQRDIESSEDGHTVLMTVPRDLILSEERVEEHAKVDKDFRAVLDSLGEFGRVSTTTANHFHVPSCTLVSLEPYHQFHLN